ncbi:phage/plasmid primase, P4 family [Gracilimonas mengyeensis]|uniref:Putative DNA primase/helicase n=1 Tax=Gracilimonas mengyeensis TaxID=1302730 RepID=A0A521EL68_9BACT|nr:phage/plasmid primase, P4 family [Gracilimonas mengyeensis]SMO84201.1 putative DNA primase/helicase [Gracilimonas mengyeensis]
MISPDEIINEAEKLASSKPVLRDATFVLKHLLAQIEEVDFYAEAFPGIEKLRAKQKEIDDPDQLSDIQKKIDSYKLFQKHYLIISIEKLLEVARANQWDLCQRLAYYYVFNGEFWHVLAEKELASFLGKVAEKQGVPKFDSRHYEFKDKLFKQFEASAHLPEPEIDEDTVLINLRNGTFEITPEGQKLRAFNTDDFLTYQLPFEYTPEASAPIFKRYLNEVLPDLESQQVLSEFMGYIFLRNLKLEKVLFLYGSGRNGKSVMFDIIKAMLGENNMSYYGLQSLTDDSGYYRAKLVNKLINWASDVGDRLQSNTFKQLASGEPIEARLPYKEPFQLTNVCKFAFNTNTLPADVEHTDAFFERFLIIPFEEYIEPERRDPKLAEKIISNELPGVFNWVLEGLERLIEQQGFSHCEASDKALREFRKEADSVASFVDEMNYQPDPEHWVKAKPIYLNYREWAISEGLRPVSRKNFQKRLEALGYFSSTKNVGKVIHLKKHHVNGTH